MKLQIFSVYDSKATAFLPPFFLPQEGMAVRIFQNCANDKDHQFGTNPEDYALFHLGEFDDDNAAIKLIDPPKSLGLAQEFKNAPKIPAPDFDSESDSTVEPQRPVSAELF